MSLKIISSEDGSNLIEKDTDYLTSQDMHPLIYLNSDCYNQVISNQIQNDKGIRVLPADNVFLRQLMMIGPRTLLENMIKSDHKNHPMLYFFANEQFKELSTEIIADSKKGYADNPEMIKKVENFVKIVSYTNDLAEKGYSLHSLARALLTLEKLQKETKNEKIEKLLTDGDESIFPANMDEFENDPQQVFVKSWISAFRKNSLKALDEIFKQNSLIDKQ